MIEILKEFEELPGYKVDQFGNLYNIQDGKGRTYGKVLKYHTVKGGYLATYPRLTDKRRITYKHQVIMRYHNPDYRLFQRFKYVVDHIDSNILNNDISNLRVISHRENCSKEKTIESRLPVGVYLNKDRYQSSIKINSKNIYLGRYDTPEEASDAYQSELKKENIN